MKFAANADRLCTSVDRTNQVSLPIQHCQTLRSEYKDLTSGHVYAWTLESAITKTCNISIKSIACLTVKAIATCKSLGSRLVWF